MAEITKVEIFNTTGKITYDNGEIAYVTAGRKLIIRADDDTIEWWDFKLAPNENLHYQKLLYSLQTEVYDTTTAVEFVEHLLPRGFFFDEIIGQGFLLNISKRIVPGHFDFKASGFSGNLTSTRSDIWTVGGNYSGWLEAAETIDLVSDSVLDDEGSTGAITAELIGLDENWDLQYETITLDGTTPVTTLSSWFRLFTVDVVTVGVYGGRNIGTITATGNTSAAIIGEMPPLNGRFQSVTFTVPRGYTYYMDSVFFQLDAGKTASFFLETRNNANNVLAPFSPWVIRSEAILIQNTFTINPRVPTRYTEYTDVTVKAEMDVGTGNGAAHLTGVFLRDDIVYQGGGRDHIIS